MNEDVKSTSVHIHSRADELITCLEGEIAKRDARIAEMQERFDSSAHRTSLIGRLEIENSQLRAELAAAPAAPAADALVEALELSANRLDRLALEQGEFWRGYATAWADEARATANGVKS